MNPMQVAIYARVSSEQQAETHTIASQVAGYVANFAQEVVKGQLPQSVEGIRQPGSRTVRPQCGPRLPPHPPAAVS
jgi:hypothetical protein